VAHSKLSTYLSPLFPAVAILSAVPWSQLATGKATAAVQRTLMRTLLVTFFAGPVVLPIVMYVISLNFHMSYPSHIWVLGFLISLSAWLPIVFASLRQHLRPLGMGFAYIAATFAFIITVVVPPLAGARSTKNLADYFNRSGKIPDRVLIVHERIPSMIFYLDPKIRAKLQPDQVRTVDYDVVLAASVETPELLTIVPEGENDRLAAHAFTGTEVARIGHYHIYEQRGSRETMASRTDHEKRVTPPSRQ